MFKGKSITWIFVLSANLFNLSFANTIESKVEIGSKSYPNISSVHNFNFDLDFLSQNKVSNNSKSFHKLGYEVRSNFFYESTDVGDWGFDIDPAVYRLSLGQGHLWLGRANPLSEASYFEKKQRTSSAIGSLWGQNLIEPFNPKVSGWIGLGIQDKIVNSMPIYYSLSFSPVFVPARSPSIDLKNPGDKSLFARSLPQKIQLSSTSEPIDVSYNLNLDSIADVVFQSQFFVSLGYHKNNTHIKLVAWQAPDPIVVAKTKEKLFLAEDPYVEVGIYPEFPVKRHIALDYLYTFGKEAYANVQATTSSDEQKNFSLELAVNKYVLMGTSHKLNENLNKSDPLYYSAFNSSLAWLELNTAHLMKNWKISLNLNQHLEKDFAGFWMNPQLTFKGLKNLEAIVSLNVLGGDDKSYYGEWRSLDSVGTHVRYTW